MNTNYTLLDILTNNIYVYNNDVREQLEIENGIEIPIIQRDYAQGRSDEKSTYIRKKFLEDLHQVILESQNGRIKQLNLDFIYGYIENATFIPLDGQQRLTTLYIIYWFLAIKNTEVSIHENGLHLFSYKTRQSAKEFFNSLNQKENIEKIRLENSQNIENIVFTIKNQPWYNLNWNFDPTVKGILQTLEDVSILFSDISFETLKENRPINFHFLQINEYGLSDNLYIKMNARGKPLSEFENFKASFENIVSSHRIANTFIQKIDSVWLDTFWKFTIESPNISGDLKHDVSKFTKQCDKLLLSFIKKITEFLFYKNAIHGNFQFNDDSLEIIYSNENNLQILIDLFDLTIQREYSGWENYFIEVFSKKHENGKIAINLNSLNPIHKTLNGDKFSHFENLMFFGWITFILRTKSVEITTDMKEFLRVLRNYLNNINQKNKTSLESELRTDYYSDILSTCYSLSTSNVFENLNESQITFRREYIQREIDKRDVFLGDGYRKELIFKFEDHPTLRGLIFNFDFKPFNNAEIQNIIDNYYNLFNEVSWQDIIRLFLCFRDYSVKVGHSNLGEFRFFGKEYQWHRILASPDGEIKENLSLLFDLFSKEKITKWNDFIEKKVSEKIDNFKGNWLWYCLHPNYKNILDHPIYTKSPEGRIEIFYNQSLNSYHHNPFVFWFRWHSPQDIRIHINEPNSCAQYTNFSRLHLKNGVELEQIDDKWFIYNVDKPLKHDSLIFDVESNRYILTCDDLIADLMPFIAILNN